MEEVSVGDAVDFIVTGPVQRRLIIVTGGMMSFAAVQVLVISFVLPELIFVW